MFVTQQQVVGNYTSVQIWEQHISSPSLDWSATLTHFFNTHHVAFLSPALLLWPSGESVFFQRRHLLNELWLTDTNTTTSGRRMKLLKVKMTTLTRAVEDHSDTWKRWLTWLDQGGAVTYCPLVLWPSHPPASPASSSPGRASGPPGLAPAAGSNPVTTMSAQNNQPVHSSGNSYRTTIISANPQSDFRRSRWFERKSGLMTCMDSSLENRGSSSSCSEFMFRLKPLQRRKQQLPVSILLFSLMLVGFLVVRFRLQHQYTSTSRMTENKKVPDAPVWAEPLIQRQLHRLLFGEATCLSNWETLVQGEAIISEILLCKHRQEHYYLYISYNIKLNKNNEPDWHTR